MAFHFPLMPRMFMALRQEDRHPIVEILQQTPDIPENCQWALFLRNHDELTLEMVTDEERDYMYQAYAADPQMRINVGIRRRLAPLLENSRRRIELLNALLFSLPGTPVIYYGDEIGMGDNIYLGDRNGVRTPMQWTGDRNAGFSRADPARLYAPPIMDPVYGYQAINVEAQERVAVLAAQLDEADDRRCASSITVFGRGTLEFLARANRKVLAYLRRDERRDDPRASPTCRARVQPVELDLSRVRGHDAGRDARPDRVPADRRAARTSSRSARTRSTGSGCSRRPSPSPRASRRSRAPRSRKRPALLVGAAWETLLEGNVRTLIERELLLPFLQRQRWFGGKARPAARGPLRRLGRAAPRPAAALPDASSRSTTRTARATSTSCR